MGRHVSKRYIILYINHYKATYNLLREKRNITKSKKKKEIPLAVVAEADNTALKNIVLNLVRLYHNRMGHKCFLEK